MATLVKASIAIASIGAVGGIGVYASGLFSGSEQPTTISKVNFKDKLISEGFQIINDTNSDSWSGVLEAYKLATTKSFTGSKEQNKTEVQLKANCDSELVKDIDEDYRKNSSYSKVAQWCVKKEKMEKVLERAGLRILKFDSNGDQKEQALLTAKLTKLEESNNKGFEALRTATGNVIQIGDAKDVETLKKGCNALEINTLETINDKFLSNFYLAKDLCFVNKD